MCGILGYIGKSKINNEKFHKIKKIMKNRGLNNFGFTKKTIKKLNINLFHSRLSIIDISAKANQPFIKKNSVPSKKLIQKGYLKFILRETFKKIINKNIRENSSKIGFNASLNLFLKKEKKEILKNFSYKIR